MVTRLHDKVGARRGVEETAAFGKTPRCFLAMALSSHAVLLYRLGYASKRDGELKRLSGVWARDIALLEGCALVSVPDFRLL